jgi:hypothetical protein
LLDWNRHAEELWAQAHSHALTPDRQCIPKLWLGESMTAVRQLRVGAARSRAPAGTLVSTMPNSITIATASHDVTLQQFVTLDGRELRVPELMRMARLREGMVLPAFPATASHAAAMHACDGNEEAQWMDDLRRLERIGSPVLAGRPNDSGETKPPLLTNIAYCHANAVEFTFAVLLVWLARNAAIEQFDIGLRFAQKDLLAGAHHLVAGTRPFRVVADFCRTFEQFSRECGERLAAWQSRKPYLRDAVLRHPGLTRPPGWADFVSWPVVMQLPSATGARYGASDSPSTLGLVIPTAAGEVRLHRCDWTVSQRHEAAEQLATLAHDSLARPWARLGDLALLPHTEMAALHSQVWGTRVST